MTQDSSTCKFGMHIKDLLDSILIQAMSVELFKLVNGTPLLKMQCSGGLIMNKVTIQFTRLQASLCSNDIFEDLSQEL